MGSVISDVPFETLGSWGRALHPQQGCCTHIVKRLGQLLEGDAGNGVHSQLREFVSTIRLAVFFDLSLGQAVLQVRLEELDAVGRGDSTVGVDGNSGLLCGPDALPARNHIGTARKAAPLKICEFFTTLLQGSHPFFFSVRSPSPTTAGAICAAVGARL